MKQSLSGHLVNSLLQVGQRARYVVPLQYNVAEAFGYLSVTV